MGAAQDTGCHNPPPVPADPATQGRSRREAALVAALVFLGAGVAISTLAFGLLLVGDMLRFGMDGHHAGTLWSALVLVLVVPTLSLHATAFGVSGALAVGAVLAAATAALFRQVPFWAFLIMAAPCVVASDLQLEHWGGPASPGYLPLVVLVPLFGSWLLLRRVLPPRTCPAKAGNGNPGSA